MSRNDNIHNHYYKCDNCGRPLATHEGELALGMILCHECMKFMKLTSAGMPCNNA